MVLLGSACIVQGCKMSTDQKIMAGLGALGIASSVKDKLYADSNDTNTSVQQVSNSKQESSQNASEKAIEAAITGNFGLVLGDVFNTQKCIGKVQNKTTCQVPLNGNTFFKKAYVTFHPETKKIAEIKGETEATTISIPESMNKNGSGYRAKIAYINEKAMSHLVDQQKLVIAGLKESGALAQDEPFNYGPPFTRWLYEGDTKRIIFEMKTLSTNLRNGYNSDPYTKVATSITYLDKGVLKEAENFTANKKKEEQLKKIKGNF